MQISEHLTLAEVIRSDSAKRLGVSNTPTEEHLANLKKLAEKVFEPIRSHFRVPIFISSGYRSVELNTKLKGVKNSDHLFGRALDLDQDGTPYGITNKEVFDYIRANLKFKQLIWEGGTSSNPAWVHVSYDETNLKNEVLRAVGTTGNMKYSKYE